MTGTTSKERSPTIRLTAQERRDEIVDAAMHEFALGGFDYTAAAVIALHAGVSQPYPSALSGTKRNLFIAAATPAFERMRSLILRAPSDDSEADDALDGVRTAPRSLLPPECLLRPQLAQHAMPSIAAAMDLPEAWS